MIQDEHQYQITKKWEGRFAQDLETRRRRNAEGTDEHPLLAQAQESALASQLSDLRADLREYERRSAFTPNKTEPKRASVGERSHKACSERLTNTAG